MNVYAEQTTGYGQSRGRKKKQHSRDTNVSCCTYIRNSVVDFFTSPPDQYVSAKTLLGFPFGAFLAIGLYYAVIEPMKLSITSRELLGSIMGLGLACGYSLSVEVRCITWLLIPTFFGKKGRSYVGTFAISYLISGPMHNIIMNGKEITRSLSCAAELAANHTANKWELKMKPLGEVMQEFQHEGLFLNKVVKKVDESFKPVKEELRDEKEENLMKQNTRKVDRVSKKERGDRLQTIENKNKVDDRTNKAEAAELKYRKKLELRCEDVWNQGVLKCRDKFRQLEVRCLNAIPIIGYILCLPLKLTFFCELMRVIPGAVGMSCDSMDVMEPGFGETYVASESTVDDMDQAFKVNMQYKLVKSQEDIDVTTAEEVRKRTMYEFEKREVLMEFIMTLMQRALSFTFILVFISAYKYNKKYLSNFRFDNIYITNYFRHIDARRHAGGKRTLLPLKKFEKDKVIDLKSKKLLKTERKKLGKGTFLLLIRALISGLIIWTDSILYDVMDIIRQHSRIDYRQQGEHHIRVNIYGSGFMSEIVRLLLRNFQKQHKIDQVSTNFPCLPQPVKMETKFIYLIYSIFIVVWILMLFQAYGLRLRRIVASFFYRKREKRRVLYLYNDMLKNRKGFLRHVRRRVLKQARKMQLSLQTGLFASIVQQYPKLSCLNRFVRTKRNCLICDDAENNSFVKCTTFGCNFIYCQECWLDIKGICFACKPYQHDDNSSYDDSDDDDGDDL